MPRSLERWNMKYSDKLKDPRWQKKRLGIMERDEWECQQCGDGKSTLNVHHKQYHGDPWDAPDDSLETLCEKCHENRKAHNMAFLSLASFKARYVHELLLLNKAQFQDVIDITLLVREFPQISGAVQKFANDMSRKATVVGK